MENKYIPLYRKYRPQTFHDLIGQENIVHALSKAIELNRIAHAYLLCGPRGTGKTSSARILAKSLNCHEGPTLTPCGKCPACLDVMSSMSVDVIEIDAASNRSVEDTQAILEKIQYVPVNGKYKIYVIDEVHMLSTTAFNSLLKTLEEPPENVIFILATTEPHKVLDTIISRCQRFDYRRITTDDIVKRLEFISQQENINIAKEALYTIAKNAQGGMRDALALLDQISVLGFNKKIETNDINEILGKLSYDVIHEIVDCIVSSDCSKSVPLIDSIYAKGNEPVQIVNNLIQYFRDLMILKNCSDKELIFSLTQVNEINYEKIKPQAEKFTVSEIIQIIDRLSYYTTQIKDTTNKYLWLELCIIDLTNYKNLPSAENLLKRIEVLEQQLASGVVSAPAPQRGSAPQPIQQPKPVAQAPRQQVQQVQREEIQRPQPQVQQQKQAPVSTPIADPKTADIHSLWVSILHSIDSPPSKAIYAVAKPVEISEDKIVIAFPSEILAKKEKERRPALETAILKYLNIKNPNISVVVGTNIQPVKTTMTPPPTPAQKKVEEQNIQKQEEEEYHAIMQAKKEEADKPKEVKPVDSSSQAAMVRELFDGKYID
ncbi:MAG: DNA polymerase III subunit gamma/tau [Candidatus Gastranaerophilales bacterium]|nr:DNA polymerase III subunit gamma/tau [Candidatus Gastranaerophilales bacterium]